MTALLVGLIVFVLTSGGFLTGLFLSSKLPNHHLSPESKDSVKLGIGLIATITALVLGLITASVKSSFDDLNVAVKHSSQDIIVLDRTLARYGDETKEIRADLRTAIGHRIQMTWPESSHAATLDTIDVTRGAERIADQIHKLTPENDDRRWLKNKSLDLSESLLNTRWVLVSGTGSSVPRAFGAILVFWLTVTFTCFGLLAPRNGTVVAVLLVCALSVGCVLFLILEMDSPFDGVIRISPDPMRYAYSRLAQ